MLPCIKLLFPPLVEGSDAPESDHQVAQENERSSIRAHLQVLEAGALAHPVVALHDDPAAVQDEDAVADVVEQLLVAGELLGALELGGVGGDDGRGDDSAVQAQRPQPVRVPRGRARVPRADLEHVRLAGAEDLLHALLRDRAVAAGEQVVEAAADHGRGRLTHEGVVDEADDAVLVDGHDGVGRGLDERAPELLGLVELLLGFLQAVDDRLGVRAEDDQQAEDHDADVDVVEVRADQLGDQVELVREEDVQDRVEDPVDRRDQRHGQDHGVRGLAEQLDRELHRGPPLRLRV